LFLRHRKKPYRGQKMIEQFYKPKTIQEALGLKKKLKESAIFLAGGTLVNSKDFPLQQEHLICLEALKLNQVSAKKAEVRIGALCTLQQLLENQSIPPCLKAALAQVVSRNIRNAATLGGHVAAGKSCSDVLPMLIALEAELEICKPSAKKISLEDYLADQPEGLLTEIIIPKTHLSRRFALSNLRASANSTSTLSAAVSLTLADGLIHDPIIALGGLGRKLTRLMLVENKLDGKPLPPVDELEKLVQEHLTRRSCRPLCIAPCLAACISEDADYLRYQSGVLVARTLKEACRGMEEQS
jgi:putative selenate reductase FAD-binding subunit